MARPVKCDVSTGRPRPAAYPCATYALNYAPTPAQKNHIPDATSRTSILHPIQF
jgi:hypothetical protein